MMKYRKHSWSILCLVLAICSCSQNIQTIPSTPIKIQTFTPSPATAKILINPIPTSIIPTLKVEKSFPPTLAAFDYGILSPDGKWILRSKTYNKNSPFSMGQIDEGDWPLQLVSTENYMNVISLPYNPKEGSFFQYFVGWSPDSKSFLFEGSDHGPEGPNNPKLTIYQIIDESKITRSTVEYKFGPPVYWSPDSSTIFMDDPYKKQLITIDRISLTANIINFDIPITSILFGNGHAYITINTEIDQKPTTELRQYTSTFKDYKVLIPAGSLSSFNITGFDSDGKHILLVNDRDKDQNCTIWVFDVINQKIIKEINLQGFTIIPGQNDSLFSSTLDYSNSNVLPLTAIRAYSATSKENQLLLFDWNKLVFYQDGSIQALLGWKDTFNGFVIGKDNSIQVIMPIP